MISYFIIDIGYSINLFLIMTLLLSYKRRRKDLIITYFVCFFFYITIELVCQSPQIGIDVDTSFVVAGFYEIFFTFFILCFFNSGNVWRNYTLLIFDFALLNALSGFLIAFNSDLEAMYDKCIVHDAITIKEALILAVFQVMSGCIVTLFLAKIIKKNYRGNGRIYMIFSLLYVVLGIAQLVFKREAISGTMDENVGVAKVIYVIIGVVTFYIFGLLYFKLEGKRLEIENRQLEQLIQENYQRYQELVNTNEKLSGVKKEFLDYSHEVENKNIDSYNEEIKKLARVVNDISLTGDIVIDSIINKYYGMAQEQAIKCEIIPCRLELAQNKIANIATILENMLLIAIDVTKASEDKWMYFSIKQKDNMLIILAEFSKQKGEKLHLGGSIFVKQTTNISKLKIIKSLCEAMSGVISVENKKDECSIKLAINYT